MHKQQEWLQMAVDDSVAYQRELWQGIDRRGTGGR